MADFEFTIKTCALFIADPGNTPTLSIETTEGLTVLATMDAATLELLKRDAMQAMAKIAGRAE
jgi:hypothetical protein